MPNPLDRPERPQQIAEYYKKLSTPAQKIDFICSTYFLVNEAETVSNNELGALQDQIGDIFWPRKIVNGEPVNNEVDVEAAENAYRLFYEMEVQNHIAIGKEYKRILDSLPKEMENREAVAAFMTQTTPAYLRNRSMNNIKLKLMHDEGGLDSQRTIKIIPTEVYQNACLSMTPEEKEIFDIGREINNIDSKVFNGVKFEDTGIDKAKYDADKKANVEIIAACLDTNWTKDETMNAIPKFMSPMVSNQYFKRMRDQYISMDSTEEKLNAIIDGMIADKLYVENLDSTGKLTGKTQLNVYNQDEKEATLRSALDFFLPLNADGTPDYDEFEKRMDSMAKMVGELRRNYFKGTFNDELEKACDNDLKYEGLRTDPNIIAANCITEYMNQIMDMDREKDQRIPRSFAENYARRKNKLSLKEAFEKKVYDAAVSEDKKLESVYMSGMTNYEELKPSSADVLKNINEEERKVKAQLASSIIAKKTWLNPPEDSASIDDLRKLSNLYEQVQAADHWYHIDGAKFKNFKSSLKDAYDLYQELQGKTDDTLSSIEKGKIAYCKDKVEIYSNQYLANKENRGRHSDMGQDRYDIAFSALDVASHGFAKRKAYFHNIHHTRRGGKTISMKALEERAGRTHEEQKQHERSQRTAQNNRVLQRDKPIII